MQRHILRMPQIIGIKWRYIVAATRLSKASITRRRYSGVSLTDKSHTFVGVGRGIDDFRRAVC